MSEELPRRARLGLAPRWRGGRLVVDAVAPGAPAAHAGLAPGDVVREIAGVAIACPADLRHALRVAARGAALEIVATRGADVVRGRAPVQRQPHEAFMESELSCEALARGEVRLRAWLTTPRRPAARPPPLALLLPGLSEEPFEPAPGSFDAALIEALGAAGCATLRVERRGLGDSEGRLETTELATELADLQAAIDRFGGGPTVDPARVVIYGHSLGGMIAPLLAGPSGRPLAGRVVLGTSALPWRASVAEAARTQRALRGAPEAEGEAVLAAELARYAREPVVDGRPRSYWQALEARDLAAAWRAVRVPTLALAGAFDWVTPPARGREIAALAAEGGAPARFVEVASCDHAGTTHADLAASLRDFGRGAPCAALTEHVARFVAEARG